MSLNDETPIDRVIVGMQGAGKTDGQSFPRSRFSRTRRIHVPRRRVLQNQTIEW